MNASRGIAGRNFEYDDEDHLLTANSTTYQYDLDGFLTTRTDGAEVTIYDYSSRGELLNVSLPNGRFIEYEHDPLGRRIAKKINGSIVEKYLWQGLTRLLAVYEGSGNLLMRFEYVDARMPVVMTSGGETYYLTYDQVGSLRVVANASGVVIKRTDYDSFGNIIADSNETFVVPFGFAGGLHDRDTGLVRFGYRDYDPDVGRWTAKDPILFAGGDTDLYKYCLNNPVNLIDPYGKVGVPGAIIGGILGIVSGANAALQSGGGYGSAILGGFVGGVVGAAVGSANMFAAPGIAAAAGGIAAGLIGGYAGGFVAGASNPCVSSWDSARSGAITGAIGGVSAIPITFAGSIGVTSGVVSGTWAEGSLAFGSGIMALGSDLAFGSFVPSKGIFW